MHAEPQANGASPAETRPPKEMAYLRKRLRAETKAALKAKNVAAISAHVQLATCYARKIAEARR